MRSPTLLIALLAGCLLCLSCGPSPDAGAVAVVGRTSDIRLRGDVIPAEKADVPPSPIRPFRAPVFPEEMHGGKRTVRIILAIDGQGNVYDVQAASPVDEQYAAANKEVAMTWKYVPARKDGKAVRVWMILPMRFVRV